MGILDTGEPFPEVESLSTNKVESEYSIAKRKMELSVNQATKTGKILGLNPRLFAFAGPLLPLDRGFAIGNFLSDARKNQAVQVKGNPKTLRSYLSPIDMSVQILKCAAITPDGTLHIGSDHSLTIAELAEYISATFGTGDVNYVNSPSPPTSYFPENKKTWQKLQITQELSLSQVLEDWNNWLKAVD